MTEVEVHITGAPLSIDEVCGIARRGDRVAISDHAKSRISESRKVVDDAADGADPVYGINTAWHQHRRLRSSGTF